MDANDSEPGPVCEPVVEYVACWRCSLPVACDAGECPHCRARPKLDHTARSLASAPVRDDVWQLKTLFVSYCLLLATGIIHAAVMEQRFGDVETLTAELRYEAWSQMVVVEIVDTLIVLGTYFQLRGYSKRVRQPESRSFWIWPASLPLLAGMLALNVGYHALLRELIGVISIEDELNEYPTWIAFFAVCVQPAIVEEAYCRGLAVSVLRPVLGVHGVVWISALMFGLMHVAAMLSIPYLILFGVFVGYVRIKSGAVWLPMILHFLHNLAITLYEWTS